MQYKGEAITNLIIPTFEYLHFEIRGIVLGLMVLSGLVYILSQTISSIASGSPLNLQQLGIDIFIALALFLGMGSVFEFIIATFNYLADFIFDIEDTKNLITIIFSDSIIKQANTSIFKLTILICATSITSLLALFAFLSISVWRFVILCFLFIISPIIIAKSILPSYGSKSLVSFLKEIVTPSSWVLAMSIFNLIILKILKVLNVSADTSLYESLLDTIVYIVIMVVYFYGVKFIPKVCSTLFGGSDYSTLTTLTAGTSYLVFKKALDMAKKSPGAVKEYAGEKISERDERREKTAKIVAEDQLRRSQSAW